MGNLHTARDFLFHYLPGDILAEIDLTTLAPQKDTLIEKELAEAFSDLLFRATLKSGDGYLCFLFEHKSHLAYNVSAQLLRYMAKIWEKEGEDQPTKALPMIISLVIYHGKENWVVPPNLCGRILNYQEAPEAAKRCIPDFEYILYDLSSYDDTRIGGEHRLRIGLMLLRDIFANSQVFRQTMRKVLWTFRQLHRTERETDYFETCIRYVLNTRQDIEIADLRRIAQDISFDQGSETIMTIAEKLIQEGREQGIQQGREQGIQQGREQGIQQGLKQGTSQTRRQVARNLLALGVEISTIKAATELTEEEINQLRTH